MSAGDFLFPLGGKIMKRVKSMGFRGVLRSLRGHLLRDLPRFRMALGLQVHVRGKLG